MQNRSMNFVVTYLLRRPMVSNSTNSKRMTTDAGFVWLPGVFIRPAPMQHE